MNWDDLRIVAAVRDEGTYAGASARLRIDETTVGRRLARIERALGLRLFEAVDGLRKPTRQCETVLAHVQAMAGHVAEINKVGESLPGLSGRFRIASTNAVAEELLSPRAGDFLARNPGLSLQLLTSSENVKFSRWEADLAIRLRKPDKGDFTISKLAEVRLYLIEPLGESDADPVVCGYSEELGAIPETQYLKARGWQQRARCITDNVRVIRRLIEFASGGRHPARIFLRWTAGRPPAAGDAAAAASRRLAIGAEPSQARSRGARGDRLGARLLSGDCEGVGDRTAQIALNILEQDYSAQGAL